MTARSTRTALSFVLMMGVVSLLADACYEGARSAIGPYLGGSWVGSIAVGALSDWPRIAAGVFGAAALTAASIVMVAADRAAGHRAGRSP